MRFELISQGESTDFRVFDADPLLETALEQLWWWRCGDGWRRSFACPSPQAAPAFASLERLLEPALRQAAGLDPVPWQDALAEVCGRFSPAAAAALQAVRWRAWDIRVPPLALQRAVSIRRGLPGRVALIDNLAG